MSAEPQWILSVHEISLSLSLSLSHSLSLFALSLSACCDTYTVVVLY